MNRLSSLSQNIIQFSRYLRLQGFTAGIEEEALILQSLRHFDFSSHEQFFLLLKMIICRSKAQLDAFDNLFNEYWKQLDKAVDAKQKDAPKKKPPTPHQQFASLNAWLHGYRHKETEETAAYSIHESLSQKDFAAVPDNEVDEMMKIIRHLSKRLAAKANRRYEISHKQDWPHLRQTLRKNLRRGGELIDIVHRRPKRNRVKLLMLCDVSKSMELYAAFLLQFMYAFQHVYSRMETFVFSTSLKRITPLLQQKNFREALDLLSSEQEGWHGGTRIGESLNAFVKDASKLIDSKTIVIILSDGWDTGHIDLLEKSMHTIHTRSKKVIWLNPLAGYAAFRPEVAGMKAALPHIDIFAAVYNIESLRKLVRWI